MAPVFSIFWQKGRMLMFQINDFVIYGSNGVCMIKDIGPLNIPGIPEDRIYYTLVPYYTKDSQIFTPVDSNKVIMRPLIHKEAIMQLIEEIPDIELLWVKDEKQRETQYKETLRKCDCRELIRIIKTIHQRMQNRIAEGKKVTASDEKYFHLAEESLYGEFAITLGIPRDQVREFISGKVSRQEEVQSV